MKTAFALALVILVTGCAHNTHGGYKALDYARSKPAHLRQAEAVRIPSVSFSDVTLSRVTTAFYICDESMPEYQNSVTLATNDKTWAEQKVNLKLEDVSIAKLIDEICIQTGSIWRVEREIIIEKKK
jgi:hypothetical protein